MFTIVITDKGGAQRRMDFESNEVTIGRVQGNDIVLPKGNVSKRHARVVLKDGRFIVVDIKSTNGTYVNGRKITSPMVIQTGDKVYVGDFILTLEQDDAGRASEAEMLGASSISELPGRHSTPPPMPRSDSSLESQKGSDQLASSSTGASKHEPLPAAPPSVSSNSKETGSAKDSASASGPQDDSVESSDAATSSVQVGGFQAQAFRSIMQRLAQAYDIARASESTKIDEEKARARSLAQRTIEEYGHELSLGQDADSTTQLVDAVLAEIFGWGALELWIQDPRTRSVIVEGPDSIAVDIGSGLVSTDRVFSSRQGYERVLERITSKAGLKLSDAKTTYRFGVAKHFQASLIKSPIASNGPVLELHRPVHEAKLSSLVHDKIMTQDMLDMVLRAMANRRNIVVTGPLGSDLSALLTKLAMHTRPEERVIVMSPEPLQLDTTGHVLSLSTAGIQEPLAFREACNAALHLRHDRVVIDDVPAHLFHEALFALTACRGGNLIGVHSFSHEDPLIPLRFLLSAHSTMDESNLNDLITHTVHLVIQTERVGKRSRVSSIVEVTGAKGNRIQSQKLFVYDQQFRSTGRSPKFDG